MFSYEHLDHDTYDSSQLFSKYWDFSYDDMIKYDLKANLNYVKLITGFEKMIYFGHSQGTLMFFMGYTLFPEFLESSVEKFIALGPMFSLNSSVIIYLINIHISIIIFTLIFTLILTLIFTLIFTLIQVSPFLKAFQYTHILDILYYFDMGNLLVLSSNIQNLIHYICVIFIILNVIRVNYKVFVLH